MKHLSFYDWLEANTDLYPYTFEMEIECENCDGYGYEYWKDEDEDDTCWDCCGSGVIKIDHGIEAQYLRDLPDTWIPSTLDADGFVKGYADDHVVDLEEYFNYLKDINEVLYKRILIDNEKAATCD